MGFTPLPLGYSYSIGQGFAHEAAPPMDHLYPGTGMGMPSAEYEAKLRALAPYDGGAWGPSQINAIFTYASNNFPLRTDTEETDLTKMACRYESALGITRERTVYFLAADGPSDNPGNWKKACQVSAWSEKNQAWVFPQAAGTDISVWFQSGAGEHYDYSINAGEWMVAHIDQIAVAVAVAVAVATTVATLGGAGPLLLGAIAFAGTVAATTPKIVHGVADGNYVEVIKGIQDIGKSAAKLDPKALAELKAKYPESVSFLTNTAASVSKVVDKAEALGAGTLADVATAAMKIGANLEPLGKDALADAKKTIGPIGGVFWDAAAAMKLEDLPNFAAQHVPWYAENVIKLQASIRGIQEAQDAAAAAKFAKNLAFNKFGPSSVAQAIVSPVLRQSIRRNNAMTQAGTGAPTTNQPGSPQAAAKAASASGAGVTAVSLAAAAAVAAYFATRKGA
jgi:hypothetical protein